MVGRAFINWRMNIVEEIKIKKHINIIKALKKQI
jgi:hypothetical protein